MTNTIPNVPRELLADLLGNDHDKRIMAERHLLAMLANAPSPAGVDGLEVIGWYTDDHLDDKSATTYSWAVAERWVEKGWPVSPLYAAPVSEAKAQGVVMPTVDQAMRVVLREMGSSKHIRGTSNWCADVGRAVLDEVARLNATHVQQVSVPDGSTKMQWPEIVALVNEVLGCEAHKYPCERGSIGHEMTGINFNSLARIIDRVRYAAPAAPAADAGLVEALGYQVLFDAIAAATSVYANGAVNISVQAFRDALAAHRAKGVV